MEKNLRNPFNAHAPATMRAGVAQSKYTRPAPGQQRSKIKKAKNKLEKEKMAMKIVGSRGGGSSAP